MVRKNRIGRMSGPGAMQISNAVTELSVFCRKVIQIRVEMLQDNPLNVEEIIETSLIPKVESWIDRGVVSESTGNDMIGKLTKLRNTLRNEKRLDHMVYDEIRSLIDYDLTDDIARYVRAPRVRGG